MRLVDRFRPTRLDRIVGQRRAVNFLKRFAAAPYADCLLFQGPRGTGKSSAAWALANELGCDPVLIKGGELDTDTARDLAKRQGFRPMFGGAFNVWIVEELESLHPKAVRDLKVTWEHYLGQHNIVIATSNNSVAIDPILLQRFTRLDFDGGKELAENGNDYIAGLWLQETEGDPLPRGWNNWGFEGEDYSLRTALCRMQEALMSRELVAA